MLLQLLSEVKSIIVFILAYLHRNAWTIIFILGGGYFCFENCKCCFLACSCALQFIISCQEGCVSISFVHLTIYAFTTSNKHPLLSLHLSGGTVLHPLIHKYQTHQSYKQATDPNRIAVLSPDMRRIRAKQQQAAQQRSLEAAERQRQHQKVERERKRVKSPEEERWDSLGGEGKKLGDE